jgi:SAM-dependent methyltransferase
MTRKLPKTASIAHVAEGNKLVAPSASRNVADIVAMLAQFAPGTGRALEIASGTGQHCITFASEFPDLLWQPTDIDSTRRTSIDAYASETALNNVAPALPLDACAPNWSSQHPNQSLIVVINLLHLISMPEAQTLINEAAKALLPTGRFVIYGPFMRGGELTSDADVRFHASLTAQDPEIGYKDERDAQTMLQDAGLSVVDCIEMPSNNLALIAEKPIV